MANINGGEISYKYTVDSTDAIKALKEVDIKTKGTTQILKELKESTDNVFEATSENIKIQKQVILDLENQYKELQKQIEKVAPGRTQLGLMSDAADIAKEIELEKKALVELESFVDSSKEKHESLRQKLTAVKNEMQGLISAGQRNSEQYEELSKKADEYQKSIDEVNGTMKALSGNTGLNAFVQTLGLASGVLAVFQGLTAMVAGENENLDKIMVKLQSTMSIVIGVQEIQNSLQRESGIIQSVIALKTLAKARAEALATKNTIAAKVAQRIFNVVARANPYVLLATALITVVGALVLFSSKTKKAVEDQNAINKSTAEGASESIVKYKQLQTQWNSLADDFKKKQKFIEDNKDKFHDLGIEIENVVDAEKVLKTYSTEFVDALILRAKALATAQLAAEKYKQSLSADLEIKNNKGEYEETTTINNDPNQSGIFKFVRGLFYKDKIAEKIENEKAGDELINSEEKFWEEYEKKMSKFKIYDGNKKGSKTKTAKTPKKVAEEYFPPGSVAEIQKRLAEIDKALSKATNDKQISELKNKRIAITKELTEAEKKIQIQSFEDQISEEERQWNLRYQLARQYGDDVAKAQFPDLKGDSYFDELNKKFDLHDTIPYICALNKGNGRIYRRKYIRLYESLSK